jgi:hypothetical protein
LTVIANKVTAVPGGSGTFSAFGTFVPAASLSGSQVAFYGSNSSQSGLYSYSNGSLAKIVDTNTSVPGGSGDFSSLFQVISLSGGHVAFLGNGGSGTDHGIYTDLPNALTRLIGIGDILDGQTVSNVQFSPTGLDGNEIAFPVNFSDGTQAVYEATLTVVPEPGSLALFAAANFAAIVARCRRIVISRRS